MKQSHLNPFESSSGDKKYLWDMLMKRDIAAFSQCDWSMVKDDFDTAYFFGINAHFLSDQKEWTLQFSTINDYRKYWLNQAEESGKYANKEPLEIVLHKITWIDSIEINGNLALVRKYFNGVIELVNGEQIVLKWKTLYQCRKNINSWKVISFIGYLPYEN